MVPYDSTDDYLSLQRQARHVFYSNSGTVLIYAINRSTPGFAYVTGHAHSSQLRHGITPPTGKYFPRTVGDDAEALLPDTQ